MSKTRMHAALQILAWICGATVAVAQERPFLFSVATTTDHGRPGLHVEYDVGAGERAFQSGTTNQPEQRVALQASWRRLTMIGRVGMVDAGSAYQSSQAGEVLVSLLNPANARTSIAMGGGVLHEAGGTNVLQARLVGGQERDRWRLLGNLLLQKPLSGERDAVDLITTLGWARKFARGWSLGVEAVGEDLEGFWDPMEAEGGARILVGVQGIGVASAAYLNALEYARERLQGPSINHWKDPTKVVSKLNYLLLQWKLLQIILP